MQAHSIVSKRMVEKVEDHCYGIAFQLRGYSKT